MKYLIIPSSGSYIATIVDEYPDYYECIAHVWMANGRKLKCPKSHISERSSLTLSGSYLIESDIQRYHLSTDTLYAYLADDNPTFYEFDWKYTHTIEYATII